MQVLLVESDVAIRALVVELLRGHRVDVATDLDAAAALEQAAPHPLHVLDWDLVDGAAWCQRVRAAPGGEDRFILAVAAGATPECVLRILEAGASDVVTDPRHVAGLRARLLVAARHVARVQRQACAAAELQRRALHDPLTDLPNRLLLTERAQQAIVVGRRQGSQLALLLLDLDRFKEVNDALGHLAGDWLLQQVAHRLHDTLRASDTVARLGGDEFAILLPDTAAAGALLAARKVRRALEPAFEVEGQAVALEVSVGIALSPAHGEDPETLLRHADVAMYAAKRGMRGVAVYDEGRDPHPPARLARVGELRRALEREEFILHYLPKVSLRSGRVVALEALIRWEHPTEGLLLPGAFIPLAEETGMIGPLCRWVLNAALRQCHVWRRTGLSLPIQVNLAARNLHDPQLPDTVAQILETWGVAPATLRLEVAEHALGGQLEHACHTFGRLRTLGVGVGIDDFGAGDMLPAQLARLAPAELKVDRALVQDMLVDERDAAAVRASLELGRHLGVPVVAEGVADAATQEALTGLGCELAQGYHLARPMTAVELLAWLSSR